ncbi:MULTISPECIES: GtrA family protein [Pseudomonas]|uniref:GtrA family protein n=1 Tax=Pseudomonas TaxID=286 RepID=UPI000958952B|nr:MULTISPECIES: GtrA family protein [Pseudomonas]APV38866.1 sugar translocase [Pseudomonas frederiksbergensis]PMU08581.1 sugar translocase [Pseudomonas sp. FW305-20]PMU16197.1 sugar translocase [Pseudomonas sp. FW305-122]PMU36684.1 sugar translocase [Pseudomonas sp. FW305-47B]PMX58495.1 sugar translocase [Pseudomonas sp. FW305-33]
MKTLWKGFCSYMVIGVINALIHWQIFFVLTVAVELSQAISNLVAFCVAVSFSFHVHALYTFDRKAMVLGYLLFSAVMGVVSYGVGHIADLWQVHGLVTVTSSWLLYLIGEFFFSRFVVFRGCES